MPTVSKKPAAKSAAKKVTVRKPAAKKATGTVAKKPAAKKPAAKSSWVTQSTVAYSPEIGVSRFTTQAQRRILRALVAGETVSTADAKPATVRSISRLVDLGAAKVAKSGAVSVTARGREIVAAK